MTAIRPMPTRATVYNNIVTPEKLEQINPKNMKLLDDYLLYLRMKDRKDSTLYMYRQNLSIFFCWNLEFNDNKFFVYLRKKDVIKFQEHALDVYKWGVRRLTTVKKILSSLEGYVSEILDEEYKSFKPVVSSVKNPADKPRRDETIYTQRELQNILDKLVEKNRPDIACALALGMYSGRHVSEILYFKTSYFDDENLICDGLLYKTPEKVISKGRGLNAEMYEAYILAPQFKPYFDLWMKKREKSGVRSKYLFPTKRKNIYVSRPITPQAFDSWSKKINQLSKKPFYWSCLRNFFTDKILESNLPYEIIQMFYDRGMINKKTNVVDEQNEHTFEQYFGMGDDRRVISTLSE